MTCLIAAAGGPALADDLASRGRPWDRHVIDDSSRGADGVKLADVNGDGLLDVDGDGDVDVIACEESEPVDGKRHGLGVFWYENPTVVNIAR